jgi:hypothetical protein
VKRNMRFSSLSVDSGMTGNVHRMKISAAATASSTIARRYFVMTVGSGRKSS